MSEPASIAAASPGLLAGKVAVVTGAASGIGAATAKAMHQAGASVAALDRDEEALSHCTAGSAIYPIACDVTIEASWEMAAARVKARFGAAHILVNAAGVASVPGVDEITLDEWRRVHSINLEGVLLGCQAFMPLMARSGGGAIINISSIAGVMANHKFAAYGSSKAAVRHLSKSIALHCGRRKNGIRCNSIHPGYVDTHMLGEGMVGSREDVLHALAKQVPLGRIAHPNEIASTIAFLASDYAAYITGTEVIIDGGMCAM